MSVIMYRESPTQAVSVWGFPCAQNAEDFLQHTGVRLSLRNLNIEIELITQFLWQVWHNIETR